MALEIRNNTKMKKRKKTVGLRVKGLSGRLRVRGQRSRTPMTTVIDKGLDTRRIS